MLSTSRMSKKLTPSASSLPAAPRYRTLRRRSELHRRLEQQYVRHLCFRSSPPHVECVEVMILILTSMWLQLLSAKRGAKRCRPSTSSWQCLCCSFSSSLPAHDRHEPTTPFPCVMSRSDNRLASARCAITVLGHRPPPSSRVAPVCSCSFPWCA